MGKLKFNLCRLAAFLLCCVLLMAVPAWAVAAEKTQTKVVRVGWYEDVYNAIGEHGERRGYVYEYQQAVAAYTGWKYEYVRGGWHDLLKKMQSGEIDLLAGVSYTDERAQEMLFSELPMGQEKYYLYADLKNTDISASHLESLKGKRVALLPGSVQGSQLHAWDEAHGLDLQYVVSGGFEDAKKKFARREIDLVSSVETPEWVAAGMSAVAVTGGSDIYFAVNKQRPDLKADLDNAMRTLAYENPFFTNDLYKRYLSATSTVVLAPEEKEWLSGHGAIRVGWLKHDPGISDIDANDGRLIGVINDYIRFASDCFEQQKLRFELVAFDSQSEQLQALKDNKIDMIFHFSQNPYFAERNGLVLSATVLSANMVAITGRDYFVEDLANTVAVVRGDELIKGYISYNYPKWKVLEYTSAEEAEKAVRDSKADCLLADSGELYRYIADKRLRSIILTKPNNTSFAVGSGEVALLSILNKTLKTMPPSMLTASMSMYNHLLRKVTMTDFVKDNVWSVAMAVTAVFLAIVLTILAFLRKSKLAETEALKLNKKLQESQTALEEAVRRAESANMAKTDFLFNMSHDIRTPMNALLGYARLMKDELKDPKLLDYQDKMEQSGNLLLSIINNVLDMARIESGKMELDEQYSVAGDILNDICEVFKIEAEKKDIELVYEVRIEHKHILCDIIKVQEIFANLVSNAIKYTPSGGKIIVRSEELPPTREGRVRVKTEVIDTGIGMSKEYIPKLFDAFSRERNTTAGKVGGTGLGMAIVKKLVKMMGGTVSVESELGKGSRFTVVLEHKIADKAYYEHKAPAFNIIAAKEKIKDKHILLAEDNDLNAEIAEFILRKMGLVVERVENGAQCVARLASQPAGSYDLIFMDIQMPDMDGYEATRAIRNLPDKRKAEIPIVAMTANAFEEDRNNALKAGMNGHVAKPIDIEKVEKILFTLLQ